MGTHARAGLSPCVRPAKAACVGGRRRKGARGSGDGGGFLIVRRAARARARLDNTAILPACRLVNDAERKANGGELDLSDDQGGTPKWVEKASAMPATEVPGDDLDIV